MNPFIQTIRHMKQGILKLIGQVGVIHDPLAYLMIIILCLIRQSVHQRNNAVDHLWYQQPQKYGNDQKTGDHRQDNADSLGKLPVAPLSPLILLRDLASEEFIKAVAVKYHQRI